MCNVKRYVYAFPLLTLHFSTRSPWLLSIVIYKRKMEIMFETEDVLSDLYQWAILLLWFLIASPWRKQSNSVSMCCQGNATWRVSSLAEVAKTSLWQDEVLRASDKGEDEQYFKYSIQSPQIILWLPYPELWENLTDTKKISGDGAWILVHWM